jgi:hypothetical protein
MPSLPPQHRYTRLHISRLFLLLLLEHFKTLVLNGSTPNPPQYPRIPTVGVLAKPHHAPRLVLAGTAWESVERLVESIRISVNGELPHGGGGNRMSTNVLRPHFQYIALNPRADVLRVESRRVECIYYLVTDTVL